MEVAGTRLCGAWEVSMPSPGRGRWFGLVLVACRGVFGVFAAVGGSAAVVGCETFLIVGLRVFGG